MKATAQDVLTAKIYFMAAFPALRIPLEEDASFAKKFELSFISKFESNKGVFLYSIFNF